MFYDLFYYYEMGFTISILKICEFYNQNILAIKIFWQSKYITGFKKFWGIFVVHNFSKFFQSWSNVEKRQITKIGKYQPLR